jgi:hypothetical protein
MDYSILATFIGALSLGYLINNLVRKIVDKYSISKYNEEVNNIFKNILDNIYNNRTQFQNRINNTVSITTSISSIGEINIIYLVDKRDIAIFKNERCIYTSDVVDKDVLDEMIVTIEIYYKSEMNDVVNLLGMVFSREDFEKKFKIKADDLKKTIFGGNNAGEQSDIDKIVNNNKSKFNIDDILDRISSVGINNLTPEEKKFLDNYKNG